MFTVGERKALQTRLALVAEADEQISAAALLGSAARGELDQWSDIDLALRLVPGAEPELVANAWTSRVAETEQVVDQLDFRASGALYRVLLLASSLQVDLSFWPHDRPLAGDAPVAVLGTPEVGRRGTALLWSDGQVKVVYEAEVSRGPASRLEVATTWHDARDSSPRDGDLVLAAVTGRYKTEPGETPSPEQDFWLVLPMHFRHLHPVEETDQVLQNRYLDADEVVRRAVGAEGDEDEVVTHWAELPSLPGIGALELTGAAVSSALAAAQGRGSADT